MSRDLRRWVAPISAIVLFGASAGAATASPLKQSGLLFGHGTVQEAARIEIAQAGTSSIVQLSAPLVSDYWVSINRQPGGLLVFDGYVPDQATLDHFATSTNSDVSFLKLGRGAPATYRAGVDFGLELLAQMSEGRVAFNGTVLSLSGIPQDEAGYQRIEELLAADVPAGITIDAVDVDAPEGAPMAVPAEVVEPETEQEPVLEFEQEQETAAADIEQATADEDSTDQPAAAEAPAEAAPSQPEPISEPSADPAPVAPAVVSSSGQRDLCQARLTELSSHNAILFQSGNAVIADGASTELDLFAEALTLCPETKVFVEGHTDSDGDDQLNLVLSVARAESVVNALIARGVDASRLYAIGYGESQPVADNTTPAGKRQNRRIVVTLDGEAP